ncbi:hypothetical protein EV715DRAFT_277172 [Schizophyllum commune]
MGRLRMRVAICGAEIGGFVAALCLPRHTAIDATVYEGASRLAEVGAGIGLWLRPREILERLGLEEELMERSCVEAEEEEDTEFISRKSDQVEGYHFSIIQAKGESLSTSTPSTLLILLSRDNVVCSKRLASYTDAASLLDAPSSTFPGSSSSPTSLSSCEPSFSASNFSSFSSNNAPPRSMHLPSLQARLDLATSPSNDDHPIQPHFEDGTVATCDVLIGADGLKSRVRVGMMERLVSEATRQIEAEDAWVDALAAAAQPVWSGFVAYRVLSSADKLRERASEHSFLSNSMLYFGKNANGACLNMIFFTFDPAQEHDMHSWMRKAAMAEFAGAFEGGSRSGVEDEANARQQCVDGALRWAVHTTKPPGLPTFVHGRTALMGDAAHSMTPFQGSGAGQAVEDAWLLAHLLGDPSVTPDTIPDALRVYDAARRPVAQDVQERSRVNGHLLALNYRGIDFNALQGEA